MSARQNRSDLLDCIRAFAILGVLVFHVATRYDMSDLDPAAMIARRYGALGVDVFFPLSGFLITGFLVRNSWKGVIHTFFLRRIFRIIPLYFVAVTAFLLSSLALGIERDTIGSIWVTYLFLTGWFIFTDGSAATPFTITWSLSVEEFAYILFGLFAWISRRNFVTFLILISLASFSLRLYLELNAYPEVYHFPPARLDSIAIGGLIAIALIRGQSNLLWILAGLTLGTYALAFSFQDLLWSTLKYTFITFGTCFFIVLFETRLKGYSNPLVAGLAHIGFYSYFTYLFHLFNIQLIVELAQRFAPGILDYFWLVVLAALIATQIQAVISYKIFEGPIMRFGKRLEKHRAPARSSPSKTGQMPSDQ